jgi:hypothetical protein
MRPNRKVLWNWCVLPIRGPADHAADGPSRPWASSLGLSEAMPANACNGAEWFGIRQDLPGALRQKKFGGWSSQIRRPGRVRSNEPRGSGMNSCVQQFEALVGCGGIGGHGNLPGKSSALFAPVRSSYRQKNLYVFRDHFAPRSGAVSNPFVILLEDTKSLQVKSMAASKLTDKHDANMPDQEFSCRLDPSHAFAYRGNLESDQSDNRLSSRRPQVRGIFRSRSSTATALFRTR